VRLGGITKSRGVFLPARVSVMLRLRWLPGQSIAFGTHRIAKPYELFATLKFATTAEA